MLPMMSTYLKRHMLLAVTVAAVFVFAAACSGGMAETATPTLTPEQQLAESWSVESDTINAAFATPDLSTGRRRVSFALSDDRGLVRFPVISVSSYHYPDGLSGERSGPMEESTARFYEFPSGVRGIHTTYLSFDRTGQWSVETSVPRPDGSVETVEIRFEVSEETRSVDLGETPPASETRTIDNVESIAELTTGSLHDPALYQTSIREAISSGKPTVVVFASPAFCTNAICGPQDDVASELNTVYGDRVNFIHVDLYENPDEIQGNLDNAVASPVLEEWGLVSQEWTFVLDRTGRISARFENFAPREELEPEVQNALAS